MKYYIMPIIWIVALLGLAVYLSTHSSMDVKVSEETRRLCFEYANRDHEKEMAPARWEYLKTIGNPNDPEFFYQSCIGHITGIPATKEYMK